MLANKSVQDKIYKIEFIMGSTKISALKVTHYMVLYIYVQTINITYTVLHYL